MKIKDGGAFINKVKGNKIEEIRATYNDMQGSRKIALWINESVSYLSIEEALDLKEELKKALLEVVDE